MTVTTEALRTIAHAVPGGAALKVRFAAWRVQRRRRRAWERARVCVVSFPKSGRTWLHFMLGHLAAAHPDRPRNAKSAFDVPGVLFDHDGSDKAAEPLAVDGRRYADKRVVLLVRDPRDVVASYYVHRHDRDRMYAGSMSAFLRDPGYGIERIVEFMNAWWRDRERTAGFLLLRYEDVHAAPARELARLATFAGIRFSDSGLAAAVEFGRFENMLETERQGRVRDPRLRPGDVADRNSYKVRRGEVGSYRTELARDDQAFVDAVVRDRLDPAFGYRA